MGCTFCLISVKWGIHFAWFNDILGITINIRLPSKSCSKMNGAEPRYNDLRYNDIPGLTMGMSLTERKIFPVITIKTVSQTAGNAVIVK